MVNAQEWLDKNYPNKQETKEIWINSYSENLRGSLIIADYPQLEKINVLFQKNLTNLQINNCPDLENLYCYYNNLTKLILPKSNKLETLSLYNNNFNQDLSFLSYLVGLKELYLENNKFKGSLKPLQNMNKLKTLNISNTDIDSGLEYLPDSLEDFSCSANRKNAKVKNIKKRLEKHKKIEINIRGQTKESYERWGEGGINSKNNLLKRWKQANLSKLNQAKLEEQLKLFQEEKAQLEELNQKLQQRIPFLEKQIEESQFLIKQQKEKIVNSYLLSFTEEEKDALEELIKVHKAYLEAKKFKEKIDDLFEQFCSIRKKLKTKLGKSFIEAIEIILTNFEELYQREWDLQEQLKEKEQAIENKQLIEKGIKAIEDNIQTVKVEIKMANSSLNCKDLITDNIGINVDKGNAIVEHYSTS